MNATLHRVSQWLNRQFNGFGFEIKSIQNPISLWRQHTSFLNLIHTVHGHTLVDNNRCFMLYQFALQVGGLSGDIAEIGVYKGGTARLLCKTLESTNKIVHLFDTFSGMPKTDPSIDIHKVFDFNDTSLQEIKAYLDDCKNVVFHAGIFPDTANPIENTHFCLVHIDVDIYKSVLDCCIFFYPRMVKSGIMVFDDYGFTTCPGAKKAVDEFFLNKPEKPCYLPTGQCIIIRI